jgi:hypothetical protein
MSWKLRACRRAGTVWIPRQPPYDEFLAEAQSGGCRAAGGGPWGSEIRGLPPAVLTSFRPGLNPERLLQALFSGNPSRTRPRKRSSVAPGPSVQRGRHKLWENYTPATTTYCGRLRAAMQAGYSNAVRLSQVLGWRAGDSAFRRSSRATSAGVVRLATGAVVQPMPCYLTRSQQGSRRQSGMQLSSNRVTSSRVAVLASGDHQPDCDVITTIAKSVR